jgi:transposase
VKISKPKKREILNGKTLLVAVDIGKGTDMGYCRAPNGAEVKPFEFYNNAEGFQKFWDRIINAKTANHLEEVLVGIESTGAYGEPLVHYLNRRHIKVMQVNPLHTKRLKELQGNSPGKTDRKDPKIIADIIELGHALTVVIPEGTAAELRRLTHARERGLGRRTVFFNQLQELVFVVFPEFLQVMKKVKGRTVRYLLKHYPTPQEMVNVGREVLVSTMKKISCGRLGRSQAEALYKAAVQSVGINEGRKGIVLEIQEILSGIDTCDQFIAKVEQEMTEHLEQIPYSRWMLSVKGIGKVTVAGLIGEVGDFRKFRTLREILKLAGLDLFEISSGQHKGARHLSKRGRFLLRKLLYFAAINTVRQKGVMHSTYQRFLKRGMIKRKALVAIARKLLRILFALVRDHSEYIPNYSNIKNLKLAAHGVHLSVEAGRLSLNPYKATGSTFRESFS